MSYERIWKNKLESDREIAKIVDRQNKIVRLNIAFGADVDGTWEHLRAIHRPSYGYVDRYPVNWNSLREEVLRRDGYRCVECGSNVLLEVDHIREVSKGGTHEMSNLRTLCLKHHALRHGPGNSYTWVKALKAGVL